MLGEIGRRSQRPFAVPVVVGAPLWNINIAWETSNVAQNNHFAEKTTTAWVASSACKILAEVLRPLHNFRLSPAEDHQRLQARGDREGPAASKGDNQNLPENSRPKRTKGRQKSKSPTSPKILAILGHGARPVLGDTPTKNRSLGGPGGTRDESEPERSQWPGGSLLPRVEY